MSETGYTKYLYQWYGANYPSSPIQSQYEQLPSGNFSLPSQTDDVEAELLLQTYLRHYPDSRILPCALRSRDWQERNNAKNVAITFIKNAGFGAELASLYQLQSVCFPE